MANVLTVQGNNKRAEQSAPVAVVPFVRASGEHRESAFDISRQLTTSDQDLGVIDVPAYGWLRSIFLVVTATGGTGAGVTAVADSPFSALKSIVLSEPNGAAIHNWDTGHDLYLVNKFGGFRNVVGADPKQSPAYSAPSGTGGNFTFALRIPVEFNARDGLGSLANQNAAATFKLRLTLAKLSELFGVLPGVAPTVRVRGWLEAWDQPEASVGGQSNQTMPPAPDSTMFYSSQIYNVNSGQNTIQLRRVGNYLRNLTFIYRNAAGVRQPLAGGAWPDPFTLYLGTRPIDQWDSVVMRHQLYERTGFGGAYGNIVPTAEQPGGLDDGVQHYDFTHEADGTLGYEFGDLWLPTQPTTRLELQGSFGVAGTLKVITNDIALSQPVW